MSAKILMIGWDSAEKDLLLRWSDSGELPTVQKLRDKGQWGVLSTPVGMSDEAVWATFYTGVSPAKHGRFFGKQIWPGSYQLVRFQDAHLGQRPFWETLSQAKKKVAILDVPKCPLSNTLNGIQLVDWMVHGPEHREVCSWPPSLAANIMSHDGKREKSLCGYVLRSESELEELFARLLRAVELKTDLYMSLLAQDDWDLFLGVFKSSHCAGHKFWHLWDESHPLHRPNLARKLRNPLKRIYQALDASLSRMLQNVSEDSTVILFSDLGMGPNYTGNFLLPEFIQRMNGFEVQSAPKSVGWVHQLWRRLPISVRKSLSKNIPRARRRTANSNITLTRFFMVLHNEAAGAIRVNLKGREPQGCVQPGQEYVQLCKSLSHAFTQLVCPETGKLLVERVIRPHEIYKGPFSDNLPDLLVLWNRVQPISQVHTPEWGTIKQENFALRPGNHVSDGILFASGPGIASGTQFGPVSLMDLPATVSARLGVLLQDIDGAPISELMTTSLLPG